MGFVHYVGRGPSRALLIAGSTPAWVANSKRGKYIAAVLLSAPPWVDRKALMRLHTEAQTRTRVTGVLHTLDHIVPLNHPRVCGLTVPWNLRVVTAAVNMSKGNTWCPEQSELWPHETAPD